MTVARHRTPAASGTGSGRRAQARPERGRRRAGYAVVVVMQLVGLYIVRHLVEWDVPVLTGELDRVLPYVEVAILASLAANVVWLVFDPPWFRSLLQVGLNLVSLAPIVRTWQVFPFDLGADSGVWRVALRALLVVAFLGTVVGTVAELARLARAVAEGDTRSFREAKLQVAEGDT